MVRTNSNTSDTNQNQRIELTLDLPQNVGQVLREAMPLPPGNLIANATSSAHTTMRRAKLKDIPRKTLDFQNSLKAVIADLKMQGADRITQYTTDLTKNLCAEIKDRVIIHGIIPVKRTLTDLLTKVQLLQHQIVTEYQRLKSEEEAQQESVNVYQQCCRQLASKVYRWFIGWRIRRSGHRCVDSVTECAMSRISTVRYGNAGRLLSRVVEILRDLINKLSEDEYECNRIEQSERGIERRTIVEQIGVPHWHVEPKVEDTISTADEIFRQDILSNMIRRIIRADSENSDLTCKLANEVRAAVTDLAPKGGIVEHLMSIYPFDRKRLLQVLDDEAIESAAVDALRAPEQKRFRLRTISCPNGTHSPIAEEMERNNPEGIHTRIIDSGTDLMTVRITVEERALCASQLVDVQRAEEIIRHGQPEQRATAVTVWPDADQVFEFGLEETGDIDSAEHLLIMLMALGLVHRDGSAAYRIRDDIFTTSYSGLSDDRIGRGYRAALQKIATEPNLHAALRDLVESCKAAIGERQLIERLREFRRRLSKAVPAGSIPAAKAIITEELRRKATKSMDNPPATRKHKSDVPTFDLQKAMKKTTGIRQSGRNGNGPHRRLRDLGGH